MPTSTALGCAQCPPTRMLSASTMTAQRQERNGSRLGMGFRPGIAFSALLPPFCRAGPWACGLSGRRRGTTERVVVNRYTGLAIEGFDPSPILPKPNRLNGQPGFEVSEAGAVWRFRNEGNRAFFLAHPEIYGPQFGGYDPIDVARGVTCRQPAVLAARRRAALSVRHEESREAFTADPDSVPGRGQRAGPEPAGNLGAIAAVWGGDDAAARPRDRPRR